MKRGQLALLGATGILGKPLLEALEARGFPSERLTLVAGKNSEGEEVAYGADSLWVEPLTPAALKGATLAVLALPRAPAAQALAWAEQAGLRTLDASGGSLPKVPLIAPHAHTPGAEVAWPLSERHLALASPLAHALACLLFPLKPLGHLEATALCGAACMGKVGVKALEKQTLAMLNGREASAPGGRRQAFNILPAFEGGGGFANHAEAEVPGELSRLLGAPTQGGPTSVGLHVLFAPFFFGLSVAFSVEVAEGKGLDYWREALARGHEVKVLPDAVDGAAWAAAEVDEDDGDGADEDGDEDSDSDGAPGAAPALSPMPMLVSAEEALLVGKLRLEGRHLRGLMCFEPANRLAAFAANLAMAGLGV